MSGQQGNPYQSGQQAQHWTCPNCQNVTVFFNQEDGICIACRITQQQAAAAATLQQLSTERWWTPDNPRGIQAPARFPAPSPPSAPSQQSGGGGSGSGSGSGSEMDIDPPGFPEYPDPLHTYDVGRTSPIPYFGAPEPGERYEYHDTGAGAEYVTLHSNKHLPHGHLVPKRVPMWEFNLRKLNDEEILNIINRQRSYYTHNLEEGYPIPEDWINYSGFNAQELAAARIISGNNTPDNNLQGEIHPLFARARWYNIDDQIYDYMRPALLLATKFITHRGALDFWLTLILGDRKRDPVASIKYGEWRERIFAAAERSEQNYEVVKEVFDSLATNPAYLTFNFSRKAKSTPGQTLENEGNSFATSWFLHHYEVQQQMKERAWIRSLSDPPIPDPQDQRWYSPVFMANEFLEVILYRYNHAFPNIDQKVRFNAVFAHTLIHELAHCISFHTRYATALKKGHPSFGYNEPYFFHHDEQECGFAWESWTFGGALEPINEDIDCKYGLSWYPWPKEFLESGKEKVQRFYAVPMEWIAQLQQEAFWTNNGEQHIRMFLQMPHQKVPFAYGIHKVTTLTQAEVARVDHPDMIGEEVPINIMKRNPDNDNEFVTATRPPGDPLTTDQLERWTNELLTADPDGSVRAAVRDGILTHIIRPNLDRSAWLHLNDNEYRELVMHEEAVFKQRERVLLIIQLFRELMNRENLQEYLEDLEDRDIVRRIEAQHPEGPPQGPTQ